ncbi:lipase secretion chaperone [Acidovorax sp. 16-64-162]|uniref:lipase secretion chaperone n=1 Tax=Acidovorax sp. 16-64-162 TaxID=1970307 RepID=UPI0034584660
MPRHRTLPVAAAAATVAAGALLWLAWPADPAPLRTQLQPGGAAVAGHNPGALRAATPTEHRLAAQAAGAGVDGRDSFLTRELRNTLEALLLEAGDAADPATLKQRLAALVGRHFAPDLATRALAMAERYVDYRVALGQLRAPTDLADPRALRSALAEREQLRRQHFQDEEYEALFAHEAELDQYTLARLEIAHNPTLTAQQKELALREAQAALSPERQAERASATLHMTVAQRTRPGPARPGRDRLAKPARPVQPGPGANHRQRRLAAVAPATLHAARAAAPGRRTGRAQAAAGARPALSPAPKKATRHRRGPRTG